MKTHFNGWCLAMLLPMVAAAQPPNNAIFKGGSNDGWGNVALSQNSPDITKGGNSDGWANQVFSPNATPITKGGTGDGWATNVFTPAYTNITKGGSADGWHTTLFKQDYTDITRGGAADGWASTFQPDIALPITLLSFEAKKLNGKYSQLVWITATETNNHRFEIERGNDGINFSKIATVRGAGNSSLTKTYTLTDSLPAQGFNYYRLKQFDINGHFTHSPARLVRFDEAASVAVRVYPNPAKDWITIELAGNMVSENTVINIIALNGAVVGHIKAAAGSSNLIKYNTSKLARAVYMVHVVSQSGTQASRIILQ